MQETLFAAHDALEEQHWWFRGRRHALRELGLALLPPGGRVVDAGCGTGADVASFPPTFQRHGLDASESAIAFARARHPGVHFAVAPLPGPDGEVIRSADLVLFCDVLEHIEDDAGFLRWLVSTMNPGAHLLMTVPADPRLWSPHDEVYGHYRRYTRTTLSALWSHLPVRVRLLAPFNRVLYPAVRLVRSVSRRLGRGMGHGRSDLALPPAPLNRLLERLFTLEIPELRAALETQGTRRPGNGVSLITVLQKEAES